MSDLYNRIEKKCKEKGITITKMCSESGASRASLSDLKVGRKHSLSAKTLSLISSYFGVTIDELLGIPGKSIFDVAEYQIGEIEKAFLDENDQTDSFALSHEIEEIQKDAARASKKYEKTKKAPTENGERDEEYNRIMKFLLSQPKDRLRGILLSQDAPEDVLAALDHLKENE